jgi:hypothetical protein
VKEKDERSLAGPLLLRRDSTTTTTNLPKSHHQHHSTPTNRATKKKNHKPGKNQTEEGEKITNPHSITQVLEKKKKIITQRHTHISATTEKNGGINRLEEGADRLVKSSNRAVGEEKKKQRDKAIDRSNRERKRAWWVYSFSGF